jgi:hypothetical protein
MRRGVSTIYHIHYQLNRATALSSSTFASPSIFAPAIIDQLRPTWIHDSFFVHRRYSPYTAFSLASLPHRIFEYGLVARLTAALSTGNLDDATGSIDDIRFFNYGSASLCMGIYLDASEVPFASLDPEADGVDCL